MGNPDNPSRRSYCPEGLVPHKPEPDDVRSFVITDKEDEPVGVLEKWDTHCWIWAEADSVISVE